MLVILVALIRATTLSGGIFFLARKPLGMAIAIPLTSITAAVVLSAEATLGILLLGWLFDRFDVSAEATT